MGRLFCKIPMFLLPMKHKLLYIRISFIISFYFLFNILFRSSVKDHQGRGFPPSIKWITDINTSITQGSCLFPDVVQSSSYSLNGSFPISFLGLSIPINWRWSAIDLPILGSSSSCETVFLSGFFIGFFCWG